MTMASDTRSEIMDAFADQLAAGGYQGISLVGVARTVGIQKPSIYHHFPGGKDELYTAVALRFIAQLHQRIDFALSSAGELEDTLVALGKAVADEAKQSISFEQRIYDALEHVSKETKAEVSAQYVNDVLNPVVRLFSTAVENGNIVGDPWFLMNAFLHLARSADSGGELTNAAPIVALFLDGARPR